MLVSIWLAEMPLLWVQEDSMEGRERGRRLITTRHQEMSSSPEATQLIVIPETFLSSCCSSWKHAG